MPRRSKKKRSPERRLQVETLEVRTLLAVDWRNPVNALDVTGDGATVPIDALNIINEINNGGSRRLADHKDPTKPFWDTSGDQFLAPLDALQVINALNATNVAPFRLSEGTTLASQSTVTVTLGQTAGTRSYRLQVDADFDQTDTEAVLDDVFAVYVVNPANLGETLLDRGQPGTALFTLSPAGAEIHPGLSKWDGSVLELDLSSWGTRDTGVLKLQLLGTDSDSGTRITVRPLTNEVNPAGVANPVFPAEPLPPTAGVAVNLTGLAVAENVSADIANVRFDETTGRLSADVRLENRGGQFGTFVVAFPNLPSGVVLRDASGTTNDGTPYLNWRPAIPSGGLADGQTSGRLLVEFNDPANNRFVISPQILAGANRPPTLQPLGPLNVVPGGVLKLQIESADPDGDSLTFEIRSAILQSAPAQLPHGVLSPNGKLEFRPAPNQLGNYTFDIVVSDGASEATQSVTLNVVADSIASTRVSGQVLKIDGQPLANMPVQIGAIQGLTLPDGSFTIDLGTGPVVSDTVKVRGDLFAGPLVYPFIAEKLAFILEHDVYLGVNNVLDRPIYLPALDVDSGKAINPNQDTVVTTDAIENTSVLVKAGTLMNQQGTPFTGVLSITEVPPNLTPAALPNTMSPDLVVTIQPGEMVFATPAPLTLPNRSGWSPGTTMDLWSINPVTGEFDDVGDGQVSSDGSKIETIRGGIRNSSWHFFISPRDLPKLKKKKACDDCEKKGKGTSEVSFFTGELIEEHSMPVYQSLGEMRGVTLHYESLRADPRPVVQLAYDTVIPEVVTNPAELRFQAKLSIDLGGVEYISPGYSGSDPDIEPGTNFWSVPGSIAPLAISLQADLRNQPTGIYDFRVESGVRANASTLLAGSSTETAGRVPHINFLQSPFGSGWGLEGLQEIVVASDGSAMIIDGGGSEWLFTPRDANHFDAPPGDFSTLERFGDGTFRRTTTEGTIYQFNASRKLASVRDRNGNETQYEYLGNGLLNKVIDPVGLETVFAYTAGRVTSITDPNNRILQLEYDSRGNLTGLTDPDSTSRTFEYDSGHRMTGEIDQRGNHEHAVYDEFGHVTQAIRKDGSVIRLSPGQNQGLYPTSRTADPVNSPPAARNTGDAFYSDENGNVTRTVLDEVGQEITSTDGAGQKVSYERTPENEISQVIDGRGNVGRFTYDSHGNVLTMSDSIIAAASGGEVSGAILNPGEIDRYTFDGTAGQILFYDSLDNDFDGIKTQLFSPSNATQLSSFFFSGFQPDFDRGPIFLPETGSYRLEIGGDRFTGDYRFRLLDLADAPTVQLNQTVEGVLTTDLKSELYKFTGTAGQIVRFRPLVRPTKGGWSIRGLGAGFGAFVEQAELGTDLIAALPADGIYELQVFRHPTVADESRIDYQFQMEQVPSSPVTASGFGVIHSGSLAASEEVSFDYAASAGTMVYFDSHLRDFIQLTGRMLDSAGNQVFISTRFDLDSINNSGTGTAILPESGNYTFVVQNSRFPGTEDYSFRLIDVGAAAQPITIGTEISGELNPPTEAEFYRLQTAVGQRVYFDGLIGPTFGGNLFSPFGGIVNSEAVETIQTPGDHFLLVGHGSSTIPVNYRFRVLDVSQAESLSLDTDVSGSIGGALQDRLFRFQGTAGQRIYFDAMGSEFTGTWKVYAPSDQSVAFTDSNTDFTATLPGDGEYILALSSTSDSGPLNYNFRARTPDTVTSAITLGASVTASIVEIGDFHEFTFAGTAGQRVQFDALTKFSSSFNSIPLKLIGPDGRDVMTLSTDVTGEIAPFTLPHTGTYKLRAGGTDKIGDFSFRVLDLSAAPIITLATPESGSLNPGFQTLVFRIDGLAGQRLQFDALNAPSSGTWSLFGPGNIRLASQPLGTDFTVATPSTGLLSLVLTGDSLNAIDYEFAVSQVSDTPVASSGFGEVHSGTLEANATQDLLYSGPAGRLVFFDSHAFSNAGVRLLSSSNQTVFELNAGSDSEVVVLPESGDYTLRLFGASSATDYAFNLIDLQENSSPLTFGTEVGSRLEPGRESEFYRFDGQSGTVLYLDALNLGAEVEVIAPSGSKSVLRQGTVLRETGTHYLRLAQSFSSTPVDYSFRLLNLTTSEPLTTPETISTVLDPGRLAIARSFVANANDRFFVRYANQFASSFTTWLLDSAGNALHVNSGDFGFTLPAAGTYFVVFDGDGSSAVNVNVQIAVTPPSNETSLTRVLEGAQEVTYTYDPTFSQVTSVTDEVGRSILFDIDPANGNIRSLTEVVGSVGGTDDLVTQYTYLPSGLVDTMTDSLGRVTDYEYNNRQLVTSVTYAKGTADEAVERFEYDGAGNMTASVDGLGHRTEFQYDVMNRLTKLTEADPDGAGPLLSPVTLYEYDEVGNLILRTDPRGNTTHYEFDPIDRATRVKDAVENSRNYDYDLAGNLTAIADRLGRRVEYRYDSRNRIVLEQDALGQQTRFTYDADDNLLSVTDARGNTTSYTYDARSRLITTTNALGQTSTHVYDQVDNLVQITDREGRDMLFEYDDLDRLLQHTDPLGGTIKFGFDKVGNLASKTDELGRTTTFAYNARDWRIQTTDARGKVSSLAYDETGNIVAATDELNRLTQFSFDNLDRLIAITDPPSGVRRFEYDAAGNLLTTTDERSHATQYQYDPLNRLSRIVDAKGGEIDYGYDAESNVISITDKLNRQSDYKYDALNRLVEVQDPLDGVYRFTFDPVGNLLSATDPLNRATSFAYDNLDRHTRVTSPLGNVTEFAYDMMDNVSRITDPLDRDTVMEYDALDRLIKTTDPLLGVSTFEYDAVGNLRSATDELNRVTTTEYDELNRAIRVSDPLGHVTSFIYDAVGNHISSTDALSHITNFSFDPLDRLVEEIDPNLGVTKFEYDAVGNLTKLIDPAANATTYAYDELDRRISDTNPLGGVRQFQYDAMNNMTAMTDRNGRKRSFEYDELDRMTKERWLDNTNAVIRELGFTFDTASQMTAASDPASSYSYVYDADGRATRVSNTSTPGVPAVVFDYSFDGRGNTLSRAESIGGQVGAVNNYTYDALDRLTRVTQSGTGVAPKRIDMSYDATNQLTLVQRFADIEANQTVAVSTFGYDSAGRLIGLTHGRSELAAGQGQGADLIANFIWTFDDANRITRMTSPDGTSDWGYDSRNQLVTADHSFQNDETYSYDENGNRTGAGYQTDPNNRLSSDGEFSYEYDAEGNRTRRIAIATGAVTEYEWDHRNRLVRVTERATQQGAVSQESSYLYDPFDQRIGKTVDPDGTGPLPSEVERFVYDGLHMALQFDGAGELTHRYLHGVALDQILADENADGEVLWPLSDHLGTVRDLVDSTGDVVNHIVYDSFGNRISETDSAVDHLFGFTGREFDDETGLNYYRARYYDPVSGQFISEDPIGFSGLDANLNRYVGNQPTNLTDPMGLIWYPSMVPPASPMYLPMNPIRDTRLDNVDGITPPSADATPAAEPTKLTGDVSEMAPLVGGVDETVMRGPNRKLTYKRMEPIRDTRLDKKPAKKKEKDQIEKDKLKAKITTCPPRRRKIPRVEKKTPEEVQPPISPPSIIPPVRRLTPHRPQVCSGNARVYSVISPILLGAHESIIAVNENTGEYFYFGAGPKDGRNHAFTFQNKGRESWEKALNTPDVIIHEVHLKKQMPYQKAKKILDDLAKDVNCQNAPYSMSPGLVGKLLGLPNANDPKARTSDSAAAEAKRRLGADAGAFVPNIVPYYLPGTDLKIPHRPKGK